VGVVRHRHTHPWWNKPTSFRSPWVGQSVSTMSTSLPESPDARVVRLEQEVADLRHETENSPVLRVARWWRGDGAYYTVYTLLVAGFIAMFLSQGAVQFAFYNASLLSNTTSCPTQPPSVEMLRLGLFTLFGWPIFACLFAAGLGWLEEQRKKKAATMAM